MRRPPPWERDFVAFFHARRQAYVRIAYAVLGSWPAAEDATQEAFSRLYVSWPRITGDTPDPYARKDAGEHLPADAAVAPPGGADRRPAGAARAADPTARIDLMDALARLRPTDRAVVALRYLEDLPVADVARALDVPEGTVKSQCARALGRLRDLLPDHPDRPDHRTRSSA